MERCVPLEKAAETVCNTNSKPPLIFQLPPAKGRQLLNEAQDTPVYKYPAAVSTVDIDAGDLGSLKLHCVRPDNITGTPHVIFYIHGAGWVFGNLHTHDKLVRELGARTNSVVLFPEYSLSPEAKYPVAIEQCYGILEHLPNIAAQMGWDLNMDTLTVAGDSVGGNMATVMTILSKQRGGPEIHKQLLFYPVTNAAFNTNSYIKFQTNYYLYRAGMMWFWNQYTKSEKDRRQITASPLRATPDQLSGLPDAMILNGEADVLRDEGEAYARKLRKAGVDVTAVRFQGIIHDFVMLNALDQTNACRAAMDAATSWINRKNLLFDHKNPHDNGGAGNAENNETRY
ncbi:MAG: alpha/beta hydrolase [Oscillospiraceae bacterium]|nr:alpha/beta hydrolase [Oscillospiraceae bacterium]